MSKKGFTLIELLAVIAILAIIMIIAIPKVLESVENSKKEAFFSSAKSMIRAIDYNNFDDLTSTATSLSTFNINGISTADYDLTLSTVYISSNTIYLTLIGKGRFNGLYLCDLSEDSNTNSVQTTACA